MRTVKCKKKKKFFKCILISSKEIFLAVLVLFISAHYLKGLYDAISSFAFSLECCIDKIPEVAKTNVLKLPRPPKTAHSNKPSHVYVTVCKYLRNATQMYTKRNTLFGLPKVDAIRNHWLRFTYNTTQMFKFVQRISWTTVS